MLLTYISAYDIFISTSDISLDDTPSVDISLTEIMKEVLKWETPKINH